MVSGSTCTSYSMSGSLYAIVCIVLLRRHFGGLLSAHVASGGEGFRCGDRWFDSMLLELPRLVLPHSQPRSHGSCGISYGVTSALVQVAYARSRLTA